MEEPFLLHSLVLSQKLPIQACDYILCWMQVRNEKARRYLTSMRKKQPVPFAQKFPNADPLALRLLEKLLAFDPKDRPTAEEVCYIVLYCLCMCIEMYPSCILDYFLSFSFSFGQ